MFWYRLADRLGMSLYRCMNETTVSQFYEWVEYIRLTKQEEYDQNSKRDWQLAALTAEVRRSWVKHPRSVKVKDFLMRFIKRKPLPKTREGATRMSKQYWLTGMGIKWKDN